MLLIEEIDLINNQLVKDFGKAFNGNPNFRVVWSDDQYEKRWVNHTDDGFELLIPIVKEKPKYKHYIKAKYILERFIPLVNAPELTEKVGYEPCWVFMDHLGNYLPPRFDACKFIIESMFSKIGVSGHTKYKDPMESNEAKEQRLKEVEEMLFGNETEVGDALAYKEAIVVPNKQFESVKES